METTYTVEGMSCDHCVQAVTRELTQIEGVTQVDVDLASGQVAVTTSQPLPEEVVRAAVDEAGYALAGRAS